MDTNKEYKFIAKEQLDNISKYLKTKDVEVHPLVAEVGEFDRYYNYTDSMSVWRTWNEREKALTKEIEASKDFDFTQRQALLSGLSSTKELYEVFPELDTGDVDSAKRIIELVDSGFYDEERITRIGKTLLKIHTVFGNTEFKRYGHWHVWTKAAAKFSRETLAPLQKLALPKKSHDALQELVAEITIEDIDYYHTVKSALDYYTNIGTDNSPNYVHRNPVAVKDVTIVYKHMLGGDMITISGIDRWYINAFI